MRKHLVLCAFLLLLSAGLMLSPLTQGDAGQWSTRSPMPTARSRAGTVVLNGQIYVIGGMGGYYGNQFEEDANEIYDPTSDVWATKTPLPTPRWGLVAAAVGDRIYAIGGANETGMLDIVEVYDPQSDSWKTGTPMPSPRSGSGVAVLAGRIYVLGGSLDGGSGSTDEVVIYDPANDSWSNGLPFGFEGKRIMGVAVSDERIYLFGGWLGRPDVLEYIPSNGSVRQVSSIPYGVSGPGVGTIGDKIYVAGGAPENECDPLGLTYEYDPLADAYTMVAPMPTSRLSVSVGIVNGRMYVIGGSLGCEAQNVNEEFTPPQPENSPPVCTITNLDREQTVEGVVQIQGTATDPDGDAQILRVEVDIDGFGWELANGTTSWSHSWDTSDSKPGYHTVHARAYDGEDYSNQYWIVVEIPRSRTVPENDLLFYVLLGATIFIVLMVLGMFLARPKSRRRE